VNLLDICLLIIIQIGIALMVIGFLILRWAKRLAERDRADNSDENPTQ
jgi:hypothetical protein